MYKFKSKAYAGLARIILLVFFEGACSALASTKETTSFSIVSAWTDQKDLYLLFDKKTQKVEYSSLNVDGTLLNEKIERLYKKLDKKSLKGLNTLDLRDATPSQGLIYIDSDFIVRAEKQNVVSVKSRDNESVISCDNAILSRSRPILIKGMLFYCGFFISKSGSQEKIPVDVNESIKHYVTDKFYRTFPGTNPAVGAFSYNGKGLIVSPLTTGAGKSNLGYLAINLENNRIDGVSDMPYSESGYQVLNNYMAVFTKGLVIGDRKYVRGPQVIHVFIENNFFDVRLPDLFDYLVIDDDLHTVYSFEREGIAAPLVSLRTINITN